MKRSTIYDIIARIDNGLGLERKPGSGANNAIPQKIRQNHRKECQRNQEKL